MNDVIKFENGQLTAETIEFIRQKETQMKTIKEEYEQMKSNLMKEKDNIQKYEKQFGVIQLSQPQGEGRTIAPFTIKKGEA